MSTKDYTTPGGPKFRSPADLQIRVPERARAEVPPAAGFAFLGSSGSSIYLLPQTENSDLVWPGWSTERLRPGDVAGDEITWRLRSVDGPGSFSLFTVNQFGSPSVIFDSGQGGARSTSVRSNTHAHGNWAFSSAGTYRVVFEVEAAIAGRLTATEATYVFLVGDQAPPVPPEEVPPPQTVPPGSGDEPADDQAAGAADATSTDEAVAAGAAAVAAASSGAQAQDADSSTAGGPASTLPFTGSDPSRVVAIALFLLAGGGSMLWIRRSLDRTR